MQCSTYVSGPGSGAAGSLFDFSKRSEEEVGARAYGSFSVACDAFQQPKSIYVEYYVLFIIIALETPCRDDDTETVHNNSFL